MQNCEWDRCKHYNYKSFYVEDGVHAETEVKRIKDRNFIEAFKDWASVRLQ